MIDIALSTDVDTSLRGVGSLRRISFYPRSGIVSGTPLSDRQIELTARSAIRPEGSIRPAP
jgi:hypothetical protein